MTCGHLTDAQKDAARNLEQDQSEHIRRSRRVKQMTPEESAHFRFEMACEAHENAKYLCPDDKTSIVILLHTFHEKVIGTPFKDCEHCQEIGVTI